MSTREGLFDQVQTERQISSEKTELIQKQAAEIEELQRLLAQSEMYIEELRSTLAEERQRRDG